MILPKPGVYLVRHPLLPTPFMLSVIADKHFGAVKAVYPFEKGGKPPARKKHLMMTSDLVKLWVDELEEVEA